MIEVAQTTGMPAWALARFEASATANAPPERQHGRGRVRDFLVPIGVLIGSFLGFLLYTGNGDLIAGSGSASVLYAVLLAIAVAAALLLRGGRYYLRELNGTSFRGMGKLLPVVSIMLLALALGTSMQTLGAGPFMAGMISASLPAWLIVPVIFITAGIISFRTDTPWGRFGILVPVAMPIALAMDLSPALLRAAVGWRHIRGLLLAHFGFHGSGLPSGRPRTPGPCVHAISLRPLYSRHHPAGAGAAQSVIAMQARRRIRPLKRLQNQRDAVHPNS